jgi:SAM-dependent methyltransferase
LDPAPQSVSSYVIALLTLLVSGSLLLLWLFRQYRSQAPDSARSAWDFTPRDWGGFSYIGLALASFFALFLELLMIRWVSAEIPIFAYFKNFVLIACFLGFGLGCYLCRRRVSLSGLAAPLVALVMVMTVPWKGLRGVLIWLPSAIGSFAEVSIWNAPDLPAGWLPKVLLAIAVAIIVIVFALVVFLFVPAGQLVGWYLENAPRGIRGYSVNLLASIAGIALYTGLCFLDQPPAVWLAGAGIACLALLWRQSRLRWPAAAVFAGCFLLASLPPGDGSRLYWSPYQKLQVQAKDDNGERVGYVVNTNGDWHQEIINLSADFVARHPHYFRDIPTGWNAYDLPFRFAPNPGSVLVLGAGTGNDVAAALRNGAGRVVAIEIDPLILELGRQLHFERPYASPRVTTIVDDARSYLQNGGEQFDMILYSLLDSHTSSSHYTSIRLDNYVYTLEALRAAERHLRPHGLLVLKLFVKTPWLEDRLRSLVQEVFGKNYIEVQGENPLFRRPRSFFLCGSKEAVARALADPRTAAYVEENRRPPGGRAVVTTDDWPFFYQQRPMLPATVVVLSAILIVLAWLFLKRIGTGLRSIAWHFFSLGAGFLLLETQIITRVALLFGTTWVVNSIVISGLLLFLILANMLVDSGVRLRTEWAYVGLLGTILVSYWVPTEQLFFSSVGKRIAAAALVLCLPVFFAGIIFVRSFAAAGFRGEALGSNLLGSLVGGLLESLSLWLGIRALLLVALALYLASWATAPRVREPAREPVLTSV